MVQQGQRTKTGRRSYPAVVRTTINSIALGYKPAQIWVHGSFARGDFHDGSDLDLIIVKETDRRFADRIEEVLQYVPGGIAVEPLVYTQREVEAMLAERNTFL